MMTSYIWIFNIPMLMISPIMTISLNSWFSIWLSLEFNLMCFIPFIIFFNKFYKETSMKYFIIQSISSSILIFSSNYNLILMNYSINNFSSYLNILLNISILMKLGIPPFHLWFINMMNNLNWISCLMLSTFQKISPFIILMYTFNYKILYTSIILSSLIGAIFGNNHQSLRIILSYSSINHMSWLMINLMISEMLWTLYFICYMLINFSIMMIFNKFKMFFINEIFFFQFHKFLNLILLLNFFSLSSLPPLFGFMMKWYSLFMMTLNKSFLINMILIMVSLLTFMFYSRIIISILLLININNKNLILNKIKFKNNFNLNIMLFINSFMYMWTMNIWIF